MLRRTVFWGVACGAALGALLALGSTLLGGVFTSDPAILTVLPAALIVLGVSLPLGGFVFVLDGVLMGAGDARYLAWTSLMNLAVYLPVLWWVTTWAGAQAAAEAVQTPADAAASAVAALTGAFALAFMAARALTLGLRIRTDRWVVLGV